MYSRPKGRGFEPHRRHCVVSFSKNINPSLVLVQPRKTRPFITERLLMGRIESNQTKNKNLNASNFVFPSLYDDHYWVINAMTKMNVFFSNFKEKIPNSR